MAIPTHEPLRVLWVNVAGRWAIGMLLTSHPERLITLAEAVNGAVRARDKEMSVVKESILT